MRLENVPIRAGVAYLREENVRILGGAVEYSEEGHLGRLYSEFRMQMRQEVALTRVSRRLLYVPDLSSTNSLVHRVFRYRSLVRLLPCSPPPSSEDRTNFVVVASGLLTLCVVPSNYRELAGLYIVCSSRLRMNSPPDSML